MLAPGQGRLFSTEGEGRGGSVWDPHPTTREAGDTGSSPAPPLSSRVTWKSFAAVFLHLTLLTLGPADSGTRGAAAHLPGPRTPPPKMSWPDVSRAEVARRDSKQCFFAGSSGFRSNGVWGLQQWAKPRGPSPALWPRKVTNLGMHPSTARC